MPSSISTSTSQMCVPKPPSAPSVLSCTPAPIGPPIAGALAARSASVSGGNSPAFGLAGCAAPAQRGDDFFGRLRDHDGGGEQHAAAAGEVREPDRCSVAYQYRDAAII